MSRERRLLLLSLAAISISLALIMVAYAASPTVTTDKDEYYLTENITIMVRADPSSLYRLVIEYTNDTEAYITELLEIVEVKKGSIIDSYPEHRKIMMLIRTDSNGQFTVVARTCDTIEAAGIYIVALLDYDTNDRYSSKSFIVEPEKPTATTPTATDTTTETETTTETTEETTTIERVETVTIEFPVPPHELDNTVSLLVLILSILLLVVL